MSIYNVLEESQPMLLFPQKKIESAKPDPQESVKKLQSLNDEFKRLQKQNGELKQKLKQLQLRECYMSDKNLKLTDTMKSSKKFSQEHGSLKVLDSKLKQLRTKLQFYQKQNCQFEERSRQLDEDNKALEDKYQVEIQQMKLINLKVAQKLDDLFQFCESLCGESANSKKQSLSRQIGQIKEILQ